MINTIADYVSGVSGETWELLALGMIVLATNVAPEIAIPMLVAYKIGCEVRSWWSHA